MLSHIVSDLHEAYVAEILKPQLGKPGASAPKPSSGGTPATAKDPQEQSVKRIRQAVYDIRYRARREEITLEQAFNQYMSHTSMSSNEKAAVRDKLGLGSNVSASPVKEEVVDEDARAGEYYLRVVPKRGTGEKSYTRKFEPNSLKDRQKRHKLETRGIKTYLTKHGDPYEGSSKPSPPKDRDGDGDTDFADVMFARMQASGMSKPAANKKVENKPYNKKEKVSEGFSNWRSDLVEIAGEISNVKQTEITDKKKVDNYLGKDPVVKINPEFVEGYSFQFIEETVLTEEYLNQVVEIATEFFYNCGLNENGVDIVIEELGEEKFNEFVFDLVEEYFITEELKKSESKVKTSKAPKGTKQYQTTNKRVAKQGGTQTQMQSPDISGTIKKKNIGQKITADKVNNAVKTALKKQSPSSEKSRPAGQERIRNVVSDTVKRATSPEARKTATKSAGNLAKGALDTAARVGLSAWEGHKAAMKKRKEGASTAQQLGSGAGQALRSFFTKGTQQFREWVNNLIEEGYDLSDWTAEELYEEYGYLCEKAESEQQQKLFGLALSVKRGETPRSEVSAEVLKIVDTMSEKKIRDFAKTKHEGIPKKKEVTEAIADIPGREDTPPRTKVIQSKTTKTQLRNAQERLGLGEDSYDTLGDPRLTALLTKKSTEQQRISSTERAITAARTSALKKQKTQQKQQEPQEPQTQNASAKMSLESYVNVNKRGKSVVMPGDPPRAELKNTTPKRTPEEEEALLAAQRKRLDNESIRQMNYTRGT